MFSLRLLAICLCLAILLNFSDGLPRKPQTTTKTTTKTTTPKTTTKPTTKPTTPLKLATTNKPITKAGSYNLITSSSDTEPKVWSLTNGQLNYTLRSNPSSDDIKKLVVIDNKYLATSHKNNFVKLWNLHTKTLISTLDSPSTQEDCFLIYTSYKYCGTNSLEYLGNGLLAGSSIKSVGHYSFKIWDLYNNFRLKHEITQSNGDNFISTSFTPIADGYLWIDDIKMVWDINQKAFKSVFRNADEVLESIRRINQTHFATLMSNKKDETWLRVHSTVNLNGYVREYFVANFTRSFLAYYFVNVKIKGGDENYIAITYEYTEFRFIFVNVNNGNKCTKIGQPEIINSIVSLGNGRFASGGYESLIKIWDLNTCSLVNTLVESDPIFKLVTIEGNYLGSMSRNSAFKVWDLNSFTLKYSFDGGSGSNNYDLAYYKL